jgi:hypothetical protein
MPDAAPAIIFRKQPPDSANITTSQELFRISRANSFFRVAGRIVQNLYSAAFLGCF